MSCFAYTNKIGERCVCSCMNSECSVECDLYRKYNGIKTNYDIIVSKTPYDLADWIAQILTYHGSFSQSKALECDSDCPLYKCCNDQPSDNIEDWLKAPADKEGEA